MPTRRHKHKLYTVGYEGAGMHAFLGTLRDAGVRTVIDVRNLPLSRRAGFSKRPLTATLAEAGIDYVHLKPLGTPKEGRIANKQKKWDRFWSIVDAQLATPAARDALEQAGAIARAKTSCLLCFEADHRRCHRSRVADELERRFGFSIEHLELAPGIA